MNIPAEPPQFRELCEKIGLALLMGQKVHFSLAHYYATYQVVNNLLTPDKMFENIQRHLSKPMGIVITSIEKGAPLANELFDKIKAFRDRRNCLVHDFDEESTPFLAKGERFPEYTEKINSICNEALELMQDLGAVGGTLVPATS